MAKEWCAKAGVASNAAAMQAKPKAFPAIIRSLKLTSQEYHECGRSGIRFLRRHAGQPRALPLKRQPDQAVRRSPETSTFVHARPRAGRGTLHATPSVWLKNR